MQRMTRPYPPMPRATLSLATSSLALGAALCLSILVTEPVLGSAAPPPPPSTMTPSAPSQGTVETYLRDLVNNARAARGLRPLRLDSRLQTIARERAATLADLGILDHAAAGNLSSQLNADGVRWYRWGEDLGWSSYAWGATVAKSLYNMWKASPAHWALLMSTGYNYFGIGLGYEWSGRATFASIVVSDSPDHSPPTRAMTGRSRSGTTVRFTWAGADMKLQLHTSGLSSFDVEERVDGGPWSIIRSHTTARSVTLRSRKRGHTYWVRVRSRDHAGNVSTWSPAMHVTVP
jgi:uncharacterized protein YkwD